MDSTNQTTKLRCIPCPFCGGTKLNICETNFLDRSSYAVSCCARECHGVIFKLGYGQFASEEEAIDAWNQRMT